MNTATAILFVILSAFPALWSAYVISFNNVKLLLTLITYQIKGVNIFINSLTLIPHQDKQLIYVNPNKTLQSVNRNDKRQLAFFLLSYSQNGKAFQKWERLSMQPICKSPHKKAPQLTELINKRGNNQLIPAIDSLWSAYSIRSISSAIVLCNSSEMGEGRNLNADAIAFSSKYVNPFKENELYPFFSYVIINDLGHEDIINVNPFKANNDKRLYKLINGKCSQLITNKHKKAQRINFEPVAVALATSETNISMFPRNKKLPDHSFTTKQRTKQNTFCNLLSEQRPINTASGEQITTETKSQTEKASPTGQLIHFSPVTDSRPEIERYHANTDARNTKAQTIAQLSETIQRSISQRKNKGTRFSEIKAHLRDTLQNNGGTLKECRCAQKSTPMP